MYKEKVCSVGMNLILFWITQLPSFQRPQNVWLIGKVISHNKQLTFVLIITFQWYWAWLSTCILYHNAAHKIFSHDHCQPLIGSALCCLFTFKVQTETIIDIHYAHSLCTFIMHIQLTFVMNYLCCWLSSMLIIN